MGKYRKLGWFCGKEKKERMGFGIRKTPEDRDVGLLMGQRGLGKHSVKVERASLGKTAGPKVLHLQDALDRGHKPAALQLP